jgi:CDP-glucose 4,6-dehydratase
VNSSFADFYRGKTVLVTGHTGFKGGWLSVWLKMLGARVIGFSLPPEEGNLSFFEAADVARDMVSVFGDIRDLRALSAVMREHEPEIVFHNAAQSLVLRSYREPVKTYATNVMGTVHVLEAVRTTPSVRAVVIVTSDKCYENREWVWGYREDEPLGGHEPYSSSKGCAELVTAAYRHSFFKEKGGPAVASARAGNVIGGGDWAEDRIVPDVVRGIASGKPIPIRHPLAVRPWQHVLEPLRGYVMLAQRLSSGDAQAFARAWNFGPRDEDAISVRELADHFLTFWGTGELAVQENGQGPHEAEYLKLDCSNAHTRLGWYPVLNIRKALEWTVCWYRTLLGNRSSVSHVTTSQIEGYSGLCG